MVSGTRVSGVVRMPIMSFKPAGVHFMGGMGPRGLRHLVVAENGEMAYDPHPEGGGLVEQEDWILMIPLVSP